MQEKTTLSGGIFFRQIKGLLIPAGNPIGEEAGEEYV